MAANNNFKIDVVNSLGFQHSSYRQAITSLCIGNPKQYYELKSIVYSTLRDQIISALYDNIYRILDEGRLVGGNPIGSAAVGGPRLGQAPYIPNFPKQQISSIAISCCKQLNDHLEVIMNILLPNKNDLLAKESVSIKGINDALSA